MKKTNNTIVKCTGNNLTKFLNLCIKEKITLNSLMRIDSKNIRFSISDKDLKILKTLDTYGYTLEIEKDGGIKKFKHFIVWNMGVFIGAILSIVLLFFVNNRLFNIQITGLLNYSKDDIIKEINVFGLDYFDKLDKNNEALENHLLNKFDFSLVSIISKGNTLIVKIKEEIPDISSKYIPITADYDMIITDINVYAGTSSKRVGDICYKGDVLVYPYEIINDEKIDVVPIAEFKGDVYFSSRYNFKNKEIKSFRTGEKTIIKNSMLLGNKLLFEETNDIPYDKYEIEEVYEEISYYFLPLKIKKIIAYELDEKEISYNFDEEKEKIISNLKKDTYDLVPKDMEISNEEIEISSTNYGNIVTIYLKSSVYLKYN